MTLALLFRGPLKSCNYTCGYCPFGLEKPSKDELARDAAALARFVAWACQADRELSVFFTPWGECLTRDWYREAMVELSHQPHVAQVVAQTNGSGDFAWLERADLRRLALWMSYHPSQIARAAFVKKCDALRAAGVRFSVGLVGTRELIGDAEAMRAALPPEIYLWVNAYKDGGPDYYTDEEIAALSAIDPLFKYNLAPHLSLGRACQTGASAISVDGEGEIRRCHFVAERLGNLYRDDLSLLLEERPCPNRECGCHIGYAHLTDLPLIELFGEGLLARIPVSPPGTLPC